MILITTIMIIIQKIQKEVKNKILKLFFLYIFKYLNYLFIKI